MTDKVEAVVIDSSVYWNKTKIVAMFPNFYGKFYNLQYLKQCKDEPCLSILSPHHCISGDTFLLFVQHRWQLKYLGHLSKHMWVCVCVKVAEPVCYYL